MGIAAGQPINRFDLAGPFSKDGVAFAPKVLSFKKTGIAGAENEDFVQLPAGTFIAQAFLRCDTIVNNSGVVTLGTDGDPDALINGTDFSGAAVGNHATNIGSATALGANGLYLPDGDTIRLATTGTATQGAVSGFIVYYELASMVGDGIHFSL